MQSEYGDHDMDTTFTSRKVEGYWLGAWSIPFYMLDGSSKNFKIDTHGIYVNPIPMQPTHHLQTCDQ